MEEGKHEKIASFTLNFIRANKYKFALLENVGLWEINENISLFIVRRRKRKENWGASDITTEEDKMMLLLFSSCAFEREDYRKT